MISVAHVDTTPSDSYVRGGDLVATYPESGGRAIRVQIYWHCESTFQRLTIDLQVSVQTDLLGIATPVTASSQLETVEVLRYLMTIPDPPPDHAGQLAVHRRARALFDSLRAAGLPLDTLSMGMTGDLEAAIEAGSTMVRVGTAIFGGRPAKQPLTASEAGSA